MFKNLTKGNKKEIEKWKILLKIKNIYNKKYILNEKN